MTIKLNKRIGFEDEFRVLGGDDYTFLPYDFTSPVIGGISKSSLYYRGLKREVGWIDDDFLVRNLAFSYYKDLIKSEYALTQIDDTKMSPELSYYTGSINDLSNSNPYGSPYQGPGHNLCYCNPPVGIYNCTDEDCNNGEPLGEITATTDNLIYTGEYKDLYGEFGDYYGNSDIAQVKLFTTV